MVPLQLLLIHNINLKNEIKLFLKIVFFNSFCTIFRKRQLFPQISYSSNRCKYSREGTHSVLTVFSMYRSPNQIKMLFKQNKLNTLLSLPPASSGLLFVLSSAILLCFNNVVFPCRYFKLFKLENSITIRVAWLKERQWNDSGTGLVSGHLLPRKA